MKALVDSLETINSGEDKVTERLDDAQQKAMSALEHADFLRLQAEAACQKIRSLKEQVQKPVQSPHLEENATSTAPNPSFPITDVRRWRKPGSVWDHGEGKHFSIDVNKMEDLEVEGSDEEAKKKNGTFQDTKPLVPEVPALLPTDVEGVKDEKIKHLLEVRFLFLFPSPFLVQQEVG